MRRVIAFLVAPIPILMLLGIVAAVRGVRPGIAVAGVMVSIVCAWLLQILPGLQIAIWFRLGGAGWRRYVIAGTLLYILPAIAIAVWLTAHATPLRTYHIVMLSNLVLIGAASGLTGWVVMRPDTRSAVDLDELRERFD